jgi:hypothetical protein
METVSGAETIVVTSRIVVVGSDSGRGDEDDCREGSGTDSDCDWKNEVMESKRDGGFGLGLLLDGSGEGEAEVDVAGTVVFVTIWRLT